ncbi:hypothetical protein SAMN05216184_108145 [Georgenia satyanarayanai]|uniref:Uncharacterized protein n=1 Tax=Georgenia satyanarayanai TaxID=860221 RepID=A0A2Y9AFU5_9MICO|nr:hypothetical protein [Georgenia satyanarayanai]PYF99263.1 hypothetical protein A8987_108145 [Georgenia satyanarayanai]SSA43381.1 hypothetical protein SAMN05216184_108145 [Georgenia satyanarayanai]
MAVLLGTLLPGCAPSGPSYDPYMSGIPEARAAAVATLDEAAERITLSDRVTVLGAGRADGCGIHTDSTVFARAIGYYCVMGEMVAFVVPDASAREDVVGAVDAELASMDITYSYPLAEDLVMAYPSVRPGMTVTGGGRAGGVEIRVEVEPFRADSWRTPRIPRGSSEVSVDGDLDVISASAVKATGADEVVTVLLSTRYWDTRGLDAVAGAPSPPVRLEYYSEGPVYGFDVALPVPAEGGKACALDVSVDTATVSSVQQPFPRLSFSLSREATSDDMQRVRDCLTAGLTSGAVAVLTPHE